jgi:hypothetical protein
MNKIIFLSFLFLIISFSKIGYCNQRPKSTNLSVEECLKELDDAGDDWERRGIIKKRCYLLAEDNFQRDKSYENLWFLVKAGEKYSYEDKRGLKPFYKEFYENFFSSFNLERMERKDIEYLFQSYQRLGLFLSLDELVNRSEKLFYRVKNFRATSPEEEEILLMAFIMNGSWEKVERFQKEISKQPLDQTTLSILKLLNNQEHQKGPKFYELNENGELSVKNYIPQKNFSVIIVASPNCGFSKEAMSEIDADKELLDFFRDYGIFITSRRGFLEFSDIVKWNKEHKSTALKMVYNENEWPSQIDWDGTPTFVFFKGKEYSHSLITWDKELVKKGIKELQNNQEKFKY